MRAVVTGWGPGASTPAPTTASPVVTAGPASALVVSVGYAANVTLPVPWSGAAGVSFVGTGPTCCTALNLLGWDSGAVRISNPTAAPVTVSSVSVLIGTSSYNLWGANRTVPAGGSLILTATSGFNFDTSEVMGFGATTRCPCGPSCG